MTSGCALFPFECNAPSESAYQVLIMWFKNLLVYRFTKPFSLSADELDAQLAQKPFLPCGSQDRATFGWVAPIGLPDAPLVHAGGGCLMICLQRQQKVLPAAVVNEVLLEKVEEIKENEGRSVGRKERQELKEQIVFELLPRAFSRTARSFAYIDPAQELLIVNGSSPNRADELVSVLRETIGTVPVIPLRSHQVPTSVMTQWLQSGSGPEGFAIGGECELRDKADESAVIRCKNQDLQSPEIKSHLDSGMLVNKLELVWDGGIECLVDSQLVVRRLRFGDLIMEKAGDIPTESAAEQFDVDFTIMTGEFARFLPALAAAFGGIATE